MSYEHDDDSFPEEREAWDGDRLTQDADDAAERAAYEEDVAVNNYIEDLKYETPEQDDPPEGYYDRPTHGELAEELLARATNVDGAPYDDDVTRKIAIVVAQLHATLAVAEELAELRGLLASRLAPPADPWREDSKSPADPAALAAWLRARSFGAILRDRAGHAWERNTGCDGRDPLRKFPTLIYGLNARVFELTDGHADLEDVAVCAPFTVLDPGVPF